MPRKKKTSTKTKSLFKMSGVKSRTNQAAFIGGTFALVAAIIGVIEWSSDDPLPEFRLVKGTSYHPDSAIVVQSGNDSADENELLGLEIEGFWYPSLAAASKGDETHFWRIDMRSLRKLGFPDAVRQDGIKRVRFGFAQARLSAPQNINFDSQPPQAMVGYNGKRPGEKTIFGQVIDEGSDVQKPISVEVAFRHPERLQKLELPVKQVTDDAGRRWFEFEYQMQNFPQYAEHDPEYSQPYFLLTVKDAAGNEFQQGSTYDAFAATGEQRFGYRNAQILLQKFEQEKVADFSQTAASTGVISFSPSHKIANVPPVIVLRVVIRTSEFVQLSYTRLPENARGHEEEYTIVRSGQPIGASFDTTFTDRTIVPDSSYRYQVLARGVDNLMYASNFVPSHAITDTAAPPPKQSPGLRPTPTTLTGEEVLTEAEVRRILQNRGFFDASLNNIAQGVRHQYEAAERNGEKLIIDHTTGLMWQQGGSKDNMRFSDAKKYIQELNRDRIAGFSDWRLPTLEDAMSLMVPTRNKLGLYIDPIFDKGQQQIWTATKRSSGVAWVAIFDAGTCNSFGENVDNNYVRAARSGQ